MYFRRARSSLPRRDQKRIDAAIKKLAGHPYHPFPKGLRVHKLDGVSGTPPARGMPSPDVWEMHATMALLVTFQYGPNEILFRNCGPHDEVLRNP